MKKQAVVVDLDGTFLTTNTFREFVVWAFFYTLRIFRIDVALIIAFLVVMRWLRIVTHATMKLRILKVVSPLIDQKNVRVFVDKLMAKKNIKVCAMLDRYKIAGCHLLMATAAPAVYAEMIAQQAGFDDCISTSMPRKGDDWRENVGEEKRDRIIQYLAEKEMLLTVVITDHYDDIALMKSNGGTNYLVSPSAKTISKVDQVGINYTLL